MPSRSSHFATFPEVLVVHAKKFQLVNWVPTKLGRCSMCATGQVTDSACPDIPVILPQDNILTLDKYLGKGLQPNEEPLPDEAVAAPALPTFNAAAMAELEGMGFPTLRCQKALLATGNASAEAAMEWLFAHMEDPDIDAPLELGAASSAGSEPSSESISMLADMGFTPAQARKALKETVRHFSWRSEIIA